MLFPVVGHCRSHLATLFALAMVENPGLPVGISTLSVRFPVVPGITISSFGGHMTIFGCRSMLRSLVDTFCELALVEKSTKTPGLPSKL